MLIPTFGGGQGIPEVIHPHRSRLKVLCRRHGAHLSVFGSVARSAATPGSDVDFLVEFDRPVGLLERMELREELELLLDRPVDLATEEALHWLVKPQALLEAIPI